MCQERSFQETGSHSDGVVGQRQNCAVLRTVGEPQGWQHQGAVTTSGLKGMGGVIARTLEVSCGWGVGPSIEAVARPWNPAG